MSAPYWPDSRLPRIATPSVPPTMRTVSFMAEPTPAWASGSELIMDSVAGAIVVPMPKPSSTSAAATSP